jgi:hypothetical protein
MVPLIEHHECHLVEGAKFLRIGYNMFFGDKTMNLTNIQSISDANALYVCKVAGGCSMYIPFRSATAETDIEFKESVKNKIQVESVVEVASVVVNDIEDGYYWIIKGDGRVVGYKHGHWVDVYVDQNQITEYSTLIEQGYTLEKIQ